MKFKHIFKIPLFGFLFTLTTSYAQIGQGSIRIGPDISFSNSKLEIDGLNAKFKQSNLNAGITGGYYVIDNLEIGVSLGLLSNKSKVESYEEKQSGFTFGPHVAYMVPISDNLYLPILGGFGYNSLTIDNDYDELTFGGISFGVRTGLEYLIDHKIGARMSLGSDFGTLKDNDSEAEIDVNAFQFGVGVSFYF